MSGLGLGSLREFRAGLFSVCGPCAGVLWAQQSRSCLAASSHSVPSSGSVSTPNSRQEDCTDGVMERCIFAPSSRQLKVGKEKYLLLFYPGTVFWLHWRGYFERSPPPTFTPETVSRGVLSSSRTAPGQLFKIRGSGVGSLGAERHPHLCLLMRSNVCWVP